MTVVTPFDFFITVKCKYDTCTFLIHIHAISSLRSLQLGPPPTPSSFFFFYISIRRRMKIRGGTSFWHRYPKLCVYWPMVELKIIGLGNPGCVFRTSKVLDRFLKSRIWIFGIQYVSLHSDYFLFSVQVKKYCYTCKYFYYRKMETLYH